MLHNEKLIALVFRGTIGNQQLQLEGDSGELPKEKFIYGTVNSYFVSGGLSEHSS